MHREQQHLFSRPHVQAQPPEAVAMQCSGGIISILSPDIIYDSTF
jgi:hypothetical protein